MKFLNFGSIYKLCVVQWGYQDVYGFATGHGWDGERSSDVPQTSGHDARSQNKSNVCPHYILPKKKAAFWPIKNNINSPKRPPGKVLWNTLYSNRVRYQSAKEYGQRLTTDFSIFCLHKVADGAVYTIVTGSWLSLMIRGYRYGKGDTGDEGILKKRCGRWRFADDSGLLRDVFWICEWWKVADDEDMLVMRMKRSQWWRDADDEGRLWWWLLKIVQSLRRWCWGKDAIKWCRCMIVKEVMVILYGYWFMLCRWKDAGMMRYWW